MLLVITGDFSIFLLYQATGLKCRLPVGNLFVLHVVSITLLGESLPRIAKADIFPYVEVLHYACMHAARAGRG